MGTGTKATRFGLAIGGALLAALTLAAAAPAQVLRGTVVDAATGQGVPVANVAVLDAAGRAVGGGSTGAAGEFAIRVAAGQYRLRGSRLGYDTTTTEVVDVGTGADVAIVLRLALHAVPLRPVTATAERRVRFLEDVGFYARQANGVGNAHFLTRDSIDARTPFRFSDLLHGLGDFRIVPNGNKGFEAIIPSAQFMYIKRINVCLPAIVVDGQIVRVGGDGGGGTLGLDEILNPNNIEALETYSSPAGLPAQWGGYISPCGTIVAWTRR